jgi:sporulation protein YlmC with PRC-barrel domain
MKAPDCRAFVAWRELMQILPRLGLAAAASMIAGVASAAVMNAPPPDSWTVTNYYKQAVYGQNENKIGDVDDVLIDKSGKVAGLVISVGGFLGVGSKDVIVPFSDVNVAKKSDKWWLTINETKDSLKAAQGFTYDRNSTTWQPEKS